MSLTDLHEADRAAAADEEEVEVLATGALVADDADRLVRSAPGPAPEEPGPDLPPLRVDLRPALAAGLSSVAAGLVVGGIFGSWGARLLGAFAALVGAGWALLAARSARSSAMQAGLPVLLLVLSGLLLVPAPGGPGALPSLVADAIRAGRALRPPVPFDPGWRVIIVFVIGTVGFASATLAVWLRRPKLALVLPLPLVGLASITQPDSEQFIAGASAFLPVLAAVAVLFGGDARETGDLDRSFEMRRLVRGGLTAVPIVALLVALNSASFLFPEPVVNPDDKPQKPRAAPLSAAADRVLFEVATASEFTGPWRIGALDVYEDDSWLIPAFNRDRLVALGDDGLISPIRQGDTQQAITITVRDLGDTSVLPVLPGTTRMEMVDARGATVRFDPRTGSPRMASGRVPAGLVYTLRAPTYPTSDALDALDKAPSRTAFAAQLAVPSPPPAVQALLDRSPQQAWKRLSFLRNELLDNVTAKGAGAPVPVPAARVGDLLAGSRTGTPFEIVAAEALLARWAGLPSRVAFGFDGLNAEGEAFTVRPRNAAQWLEVWFEGYGWVPLIGTPKRAEASLDTDPNARFNPGIEPSDDVAVEVYLPFETQDLTQLYQRVRDVLATWLPVVVLGAGAWIGWPAGAKALRRARRRRWAAARGPRTQIVVEYAEVRDAAIDLGIGDVYDTPLEYLAKVRDDQEHRELAWLASRALFGDLIGSVTEADVAAAEELSASVRRRLAAAQPLEVRLVALVSRASLAQPYTEEIPNIAHLRLPGAEALRRLVGRRPRRRRPALRARLTGGLR